MAKRITVVVSQGQSAHPDKRKLEEDLVAALLFENGVDVTVVPNLYDLAPGSTGMLCLEGIKGDMVVLSWLYPRAAHWTLDRHAVRGQFGQTLLAGNDEDEDEESEEDGEKAATDEDAADKPAAITRPIPLRTIYHLDLRSQPRPEPYIAEIKRILAETSVETVSLLGSFTTPSRPAIGSPDANGTAGANGAAGANGTANKNGSAAGNPAAGFISLLGGGPTDAPSPGNGAAPSSAPVPESTLQPGGPIRIEETPTRRWYPVIDYSRCTNCMECIDFCLFGVYGVDGAETILVEQPDNCRKGCPACSRVCPENAIIFPQHKSAAIAGSPSENAGGLKIDLSQLFGAPSAIEVAALERDEQLVAVGREAVGLSVGIPKRQEGKAQEPKDELDSLMDQLDDF
jgi:NAD-dependent dihydropyrimidine dehydrogenase PreA subunit